MMSKILLIICLFFTLPAQAMEEVDTQDSLCKKIAPGVYAGKKTVGNETVYFGMEKVHGGNIKQWDKYVKLTDTFTDNNGCLNCWRCAFAGIPQYRIPSYDIVQHITGFTETEHNDFMNVVKTYVENDRNEGKAIREIASKTVGFCITTDKPTRTDYVVYASKKPITGEFLFSTNFLEEKVLLKQYLQYFKDLLMIVGSMIPANEYIYDKCVYVNNGLFENPLSLIQDGKKYPGLAIQLHAFSAVAVDSAVAVNS